MKTADRYNPDRARGIGQARRHEAAAILDNSPAKDILRRLVVLMRKYERWNIKKENSADGPRITLTGPSKISQVRANGRIHEQDASGKLCVGVSLSSLDVFKIEGSMVGVDRREEGERVIEEPLSVRVSTYSLPVSEERLLPTAMKWAVLAVGCVPPGGRDHKFEAIFER